MRLIRDFRDRHGAFRPFVLLTGLLAAILLSGPVQGHSLLDEDDFSTVTEARRMQEKVIDLIDDVRRAVVGVEIEFRNDDGRITGVAGGSGTIIDVEDGKSNVLIENVMGKYRLEITAFNEVGSSAPRKAFFDCSRDEVEKSLQKVANNL